MPNSMMWFRRDLRLADNHTLVAAVDAARAGNGAVLAVFVLDDALWEPSGPNRRWFLARCLAELDEALGGGLVIRHGVPSEVVPALAAEYDCATVLRAQDVGVYGRRRDEAVAAALEAAGRQLVEADSPWVVPPGTLHTGAGGTFRVYSAYLRAWRGQRVPERVARPRDIPLVEGVASDGPPAPPNVTADLPEPGERAAQQALERFVLSRLDDYTDVRNRPDLDATSRLSPYLRFGCLHPRQLLRRLDRRTASHDTFAKELAWRDFYADVLDAWPESARRAWNPAMRAMKVDGGRRADERFAAWCDGKTGFPIVDAGMRQLLAEGWMHNRVRMITASFLVKDLHVDWTRGARFFMHHLVDGDLSSNNHGWQWVAGTGTDAAPYHRIFNPTVQSERFDPDGTYIRRWVPELADVETARIHAPSAAPDGPPSGYPPPIVDHATERDEALARYRAIR